MSRRLLFLLATILLLAFLAGDAPAQCAMCKAVVTSNEGNTFGGEQAIGKGLNRGILFLLAIPYLLIFVVFRRRIVAFFREFSSAQG